MTEKTEKTQRPLSDKEFGIILLTLFFLGYWSCLGVIDGNASGKTSKHNYNQDYRVPGVRVEKGAYIDYRIDSDKIINLSVNAIRYKGYPCNSLSSIKLYKYPERIEVKCNGGRDRYKIQRDSAGQLRQVTRM